MTKGLEKRAELPLELSAVHWANHTQGLAKIALLGREFLKDADYQEGEVSQPARGKRPVQLSWLSWDPKRVIYLRRMTLEWWALGTGPNRPKAKTSSSSLARRLNACQGEIHLLEKTTAIASFTLSYPWCSHTNNSLLHKHWSTPEADTVSACRTRLCPT